ncbi:MAG: carboxypeptidase regulatory-like domain-containing protein [Anaerolineales bacterium]|nr:carboxypeptidase regulatory-like domain-containing protein [Anaerolineales bacterium]
MPLTDSPDIEDNLESLTSEPRQKIRWARWFLAFAVLLTFFMLTVRLAQQSKTFRGRGAVRGFVVDPSGNPVENAEIFVSGVEAWVNCGQDGSFVFEDIPAGQYTVMVVVTPGPVDSEISIPVEIAAGEKLNLGTITFDLPAVQSPGGN